MAKNGLSSVGQRKGSSIPFDAVLVPTGSRRLKENRQFVRMNIIERLVRTPTCSINHERLKKDHDIEYFQLYY